MCCKGLVKKSSLKKSFDSKLTLLHELGCLI